MFKAVAIICDLQSATFGSNLENPSADDQATRTSLRLTEATAEWENEETIQSISAAWQRIGYETFVIRLDEATLATFTQLNARFRNQLLVHSLVEGWGTPSREAWVPALCESHGVPWIGSGVSAFVTCMDKDLVATLARQLNIRAPKGRLVQSPQDYESFLTEHQNHRHFVKPNFEGSGMGIDAASLRPEHSQLSTPELTALLHRFPDGLRVEEVLEGRELTSGLIADEHFLPIAEIKVPGGIYGIEHKQKDVMTEEVTFPQLTPSAAKAIEHGSRILWRRLGLQDFARFDWKCDANGVPHLLEINPLAGLSPHYSVFPLIWKQTGANYEKLLETLASSAAKKCQGRSLYYGRRVSGRGQP
jgi:D-alanine-D-alanine ligase